MYRLFDKADKIVCGDAEKYFYFQRRDSIVNREFDRRRMDYISFTGECILYMEEKHPELKKAAISRHFSACFDLLSSGDLTKRIMRTRTAGLSMKLKNTEKRCWLISRHG